MFSSIPRIIMRIVCAAAILTVGDLAFYFWRFAPGQWLTISQDTDEWARFGEYVGGTLGPIFSLFALLGLFLTILDQREQLNGSRRREDSKVYLNQAQELWRQAYDIFCKATDHTEYCRADSERWSTTARLIRGADALEHSISDPAHLVVYRAQRSVAQHQFFELLRIETGSFPITYFRGNDPGIHEMRMGWPYPPTEPVLVPLYRFALAGAMGAELDVQADRFTTEELRPWYQSTAVLINLVNYVRELRNDPELAM